MPGFVREHLRPLAGSAALHLLLLAIAGGLALKWTSEQPPVELAIQGVAVDARDLPRSVREGRAIDLPTPASKPEPDHRVEQQAARAAEAQAQAELAREAQLARQAQERQLAAEHERVAAREAAEQVAAEKAAAEKAAARKAAAEKAAADKAAAEKAAAAKAAAADKAAKQKAEAQAARDRAAGEADLKRALAAEEAEASVHDGVRDEYRAMLVQAIERNWIRPPSARSGLACTLYVTQAPGGTVVDVKLGSCNGDDAVRESVVTAVYKASPLPPPRDARAFERRLEIMFRPKD